MTLRDKTSSSSASGIVAPRSSQERIEQIRQQCASGSGSWPQSTVVFLLDALAAVDPAPGWQPIETAPKDGTEILVKHGEFASVVWWEETGQGWIVAALADESIYAPEPTLWMPLPPVPVRASDPRQETPK